MIKIKDLFTIAAILCSFSVLHFASEGSFVVASCMILIATVLDLGDGWYARLTKTGNAFGKHFDTIADLLIYSLAPGIVLFFMFKPHDIALAFVMGAIPLVFGCIRLARFNVQAIEFPGYWVGFCRPGVMLVILGLLHMQLFDALAYPYVTLAIVAVASVLNVSTIPYIGHHKRTFSKAMKMRLMVATVVLIAALFTSYAWDVVFLYALLYMISPLFMTPAKDKKKFKKFVAKWKKKNE